MTSPEKKLLLWHSALLIAFLGAALPLRAADTLAQASTGTPQSPAQIASPATVAPHNDATSTVAPPVPETPKAPETTPPDTASAPAADTTSAPASDAAPSAASPNAMVDFFKLMEKKGMLTKDESKTLVAEAQKQAADQAAAAAKASAPPEGAMDVTYVPGPVRDQLREEVKDDVMTEARDQNWADPRIFPSWLSRISLFGDVRVRYEGDFFPSGNAVGHITNFNAINSGSPYNIFGTSPLPTYNVDQDRQRLRLRARFGLDSDLGDGFSAGFRIATGSDDSPVTENQSFGAATGQGGNFSKYSIWLDRGFLKWERGGEPDDLYQFSATVGRFDNPFFHTSMIWADDLGFDGFALQGKYKVVDGVTPFFDGGVFPVFNTDLNFGTNSTNLGQGYGSQDKWLYGAQLGADLKINDDFNLKVAGAFYDFQDIQGQVSGPISSTAIASNTSFNGPTDDSRPAFAQNGNTYIALRDIIQDGATPYEPQYYGLATPFREAAVTARLDFNRFDPFHMALTGEFVDNVAFNRQNIENNGPTFGGTTPEGPRNNLGSGGGFDGGNLGWLLRLDLGHVALEKRWDWNVNIGYRYVQSDATVDGFADSDFGGYIAGTNLKGYTIGGSLALSSRVWTSIRWMSADAIAGPPLKDDTLQFDVNAKF